MLKKVYSILAILFTSAILIACTPEVTSVQLPVLNGLNTAEITTRLNDLGFEFEIQEEMNFSVIEGTFVRYGNGLVPGRTVNPSEETLLVFISTHKMFLPDLNGLTEAEITNRLRGFQINITYQYRETTEVEPGTFIEYAGTFDIGLEVYKNTNVPVVIATYPDSYRSPIFISKYVSGVNNDRAIEIFNGLENEADLSGYTLNFYLNGSETISNSYVIPEGTTLSANETLLIVHSNANEDLKSRADILTDSLTFDGNDYIELNDYRDALIDVFGRYKFTAFGFSNRISVRKSSVSQSNTTFEMDEWDTYYREHYIILDSHPTTFPTTFTFHPEHLELDFYTQANGMLRVTYVSNNDGDTARFVELSESVRFYGINTLESNDPDPARRALSEASGAFVQVRLQNATNIYIQSPPDGRNTETYGRYLGWIWYDGRLVNYEVVLAGYSQNFYNDPTDSLVYNGVTLNEWFRRAESIARANRLGIWAL